MLPYKSLFVVCVLSICPGRFNAKKRKRKIIYGGRDNKI